MGKKIKRLSCVLLAIVMCMGMTVPAMAASSKYNAAVASYKRYMRGKCGSYLIVDIDGNGVPELLFHNTTGWYNEIRSYNTRAKKSVRLKSSGFGKGYNMPMKYSKRCHTVILPSASTGGGREVIYRVRGTKASKICTVETRNNKFGKSGYYISGKKVSTSAYNKTYNKYMRNYYIVYWN